MTDGHLCDLIFPLCAVGTARADRASTVSIFLAVPTALTVLASHLEMLARSIKHGILKAI